MDFSKLSASDKRILIAAAVVVVTGLTSVTDKWGAGVIIGLLAGLAAIAVVLLPQMSPGTKLPAPKGLSLLVLGIAATAGFALSALTYLDHVVLFNRLYSLLFDAGLVASVVLLWFGWVAYQAESKSAAPTA